MVVVSAADHRSRPATIPPYQDSNLNQVWTIESQGVNGVLSRSRASDPAAISEFLKVVFEIIGTKVDETEAVFLKIWRRPLTVLDPVARVASIV
jgi:hypothetical protein